MNTRFLLTLLIALLMLSVGCRKTSNVATPSGGSGAAMAQEHFTLQDMRDAILKGCADKNWRAVETDANTIEATNIVRNKHTVVVSIPYTAKSYSINYKSSSNMGYKAKSDGTFSIHPNYNNWVNNLDKAIRANIAQKK
ncbi:MAG: hypothetical protein FWG59_04165 [Betaproteobacteria bacterium]|nr:hypothetical protein [Betaproteobacteria bacterium]